MLRSTARFETSNGARYLQALCKHFGHKVAVTYDTARGEAALPPGPAQFSADATGLDIAVSATDAAGLARARAIVEDHLLRFAFREDPEPLAWTQT